MTGSQPAQLSIIRLKGLQQFQKIGKVGGVGLGSDHTLEFVELVSVTAVSLSRKQIRQFRG